MHRADIVYRKTCYDFIGNSAKLKAWQKQLLSAGLAEKSVVADFEEIFAQFYLSNTYLGQLCNEECGDNACVVTNCG